MLSIEAMRCRVDLADSRELFRFETLVQDAAKNLSAEAVAVAIEAHRLQSSFMPTISDLMKASAEWRADRAADARRRQVMLEARQDQRRLAAPQMSIEDWDEHVTALLTAMAAAPGPPERNGGYQ